jgi:hypothetical protein
MIDVALVHRTFGSDRNVEANYSDLCSLGGVISVDASKSLGKTIGSMGITLSAKEIFKQYFTQNDSIDLYISNDKLVRTSLKDMYSNNPNSFIFAGTIGSLITNFVEGKEVIDIDCADKTIVLTNINAKRTSYSNGSPAATYIYRATEDATHLSAITNLISEVNEDMRTSYNEDTPGTGDYWNDITIAVDSDDCSDVTGFTRLNTGFPFKTYAEIFNDFAGGTYTNDIQFTYWIDASDVFHWKKLTNVKTDDLIYGTDKINSIKFSEEVYDTITASIVNGGIDLNGTGIWAYAYNTSNATALGLRWDIYANTNASKDRRGLNKVYDSQTPNSTKGYGTATSVSGKVLTDTNQAWTVNELANMYLINPSPPNSFKIVSNTATTITVDGEGLKASEYTIYDGTNADFRAEIKEIVVSEAEARLAKTAKLRYKGTIVLNGTNSHDLNEVYDIVQNYFGFTTISPKRMRLSDIAHNIGEGSWKTTLTFKEDVGTEGAQ